MFQGDLTLSQKEDAVKRAVFRSSGGQLQTTGIGWNAAPTKTGEAEIQMETRSGCRAKVGNQFCDVDLPSLVEKDSLASPLVSQKVARTVVHLFGSSPAQSERRTG